MAQNNNRKATKNSVSRSSNYFSSITSSKQNMLIFILVFAAIGVFLIWRSMAANGIVLNSSKIDAAQSSPLCTLANSFGCYSVVPETTGSKKNSQVIELAAASKTSSSNVSLLGNTFYKGYWQVCLLAKSLGGIATGTVQVFNNDNTGPVGGPINTIDYTVSNTNDYGQYSCIKNVYFSGVYPNLEFTISNAGPAMRVSSILATKLPY